MTPAGSTESLCLKLSDPGIFERGEAPGIFSTLRRERSVWWCPDQEGGGFWSVLGYRDIVSVLKDPRLYSAARRHGWHHLQSKASAALSQDFGESLLRMDPPEHEKQRAIVAPALLAERVRAMETSIRARVTALLDAIARRGECEFVSAVAAELPLQVVTELFGLPQEDRGRLFAWSNALVGEEDPDMRPSEEQFRVARKEMADYALKHWRDRLRRPGGQDIVSLLVNAGLESEEEMSLTRYTVTFYTLLSAGNETVRGALAGGLLALSQHPEQRRQLTESPALIAGAAKEILRWVTPFTHFRRTAMADTELGGQRIAKGDAIILWYRSGNFDEQVFEEPERFDVTRSGPPHLAFGYGAHYCMGSRLAELEITVLFQELLRRFPGMEPCGPIRRIRSSFVNVIKEMPVRFTPER